MARCSAGGGTGRGESTRGEIRSTLSPAEFQRHRNGPHTLAGEAAGVTRPPNAGGRGRGRDGRGAEAGWAGREELAAHGRIAGRTDYRRVALPDCPGWRR